MFVLHLLLSIYMTDRIRGVMVFVLHWSVLESWFNFQSDQTRYYEIGIG